MKAEVLAQKVYQLELSEEEASILLSMCAQDITIPRALRQLYDPHFVDKVSKLMSTTKNTLLMIGVTATSTES